MSSLGEGEGRSRGGEREGRKGEGEGAPHVGPCGSLVLIDAALQAPLKAQYIAK